MLCILLQTLNKGNVYLIYLFSLSLGKYIVYGQCE